MLTGVDVALLAFRQPHVMMTSRHQIIKDEHRHGGQSSKLHIEETSMNTLVDEQCPGL